MAANDVFHEITGLHQFLERIRKHPYNSDQAGTGWVGNVTSFQQAFDLARDGWSDVRDTASGIVDQIIGDIRSTSVVQPVAMYDMVGAHVDLCAAVAGEPDFMVRLQQQDVHGSDQVVRLLIDAGAQGSVSGTRMLTRAAAVAALVDLVNMSSRSVDIFLTSPVWFKREGGRSHNLLLHLHHAGEPLDVDALMFCLGHPAFHRYLWFAHRNMDGVGSSMGSSYDINPSLVSRVEPDLVVRRQMWRQQGEPDVYDYPADWVRWSLNKLGVLTG